MSSSTTSSTPPRFTSELEAVKPVLVLLAFAAVGLALSKGLVESLGASPQFAFTLAGSFAVYLATHPARREVIVTIALAAAIRLAYAARYPVTSYFGSPLISFGGFLGVAGLLMLAIKAVRLRRFADFGTAAFFPFVSILVGFILPISNQLSPKTFDTHLLAADGATGFQPSFLLGRLITGRPLLWNLTATVYYALPLAVALLCAAQVRKRPGEVRRLLWLFGWMSAVGFCLFAVCPATGPIYAFRGSFPFHVPGLSFVALPVPGAPRNALPSLHFGTALLMFWNTRFISRAGRIGAALFLAATAFAILALGEHYLIDIVVALPFCVSFQAAFSDPASVNAAWRIRSLWTGTVLVALWLFVLRFRAEPLSAWPIAACLAFAATASVSIWMRRRLRS